MALGHDGSVFMAEASSYEYTVLKLDSDGNTLWRWAVRVTRS